MKNDQFNDLALRLYVALAGNPAVIERTLKEPDEDGHMSHESIAGMALDMADAMAATLAQEPGTATVEVVDANARHN